MGIYKKNMFLAEDGSVHGHQIMENMMAVNQA